MNISKEISFKGLWLLTAFFCFAVMQWNLPNLGNNLTPRNLFGWAFLVLSTSWCWAQTVRTAKFIYHPVIGALLLPPIVVLIWAIAGQTSTYPYYSTTVFFSLFFGAAWVTGLIQLELSQKKWENIAWLINISAAFLASICLLSPNYFNLNEIYANLPLPLRIPDGGFQQRNSFASYLTASNIFLIWSIIRQGSRIKHHKTLAIVLLNLLTGLIIFNGGSRTGIFTLVLSHTFITIWVWKKYTSNIKFSLISAGATLITLLLSLFPETFNIATKLALNERIPDLLNGVATIARIDMWIVSVYSWLDAPWFGHGLGRFTEVFTPTFIELVQKNIALKYTENLGHPHNETLLWLIETGIIGTAGVFLPWIFLIYWTCKRLGTSCIGWLACLLPITIHTQTEFPLHGSGAHWWLLGLIIAAAIPTDQLRKTVLSSNERILQASRAFVLAIGVLPFMFLVDSAITSHKIGLHIKKSSFNTLEEIFTRWGNMPEFSHPLLGAEAQDIFTQQTLPIIINLKDIELADRWFLRSKVLFLHFQNKENCSDLMKLCELNNYKKINESCNLEKYQYIFHIEK